MPRMGYASILSYFQDSPEFLVLLLFYFILLNLIGQHLINHTKHCAMCWWLYIDMDWFLFFPRGMSCETLTHWYFEACCSHNLFHLASFFYPASGHNYRCSYNKLLHYSMDHHPKQVFKHVGHLTYMHLTYLVFFGSWTLKGAPGTLDDG